MPDTLTQLAARLARLERRVTSLERAIRRPEPPWHDLPLTGDTALPDDPGQRPMYRAAPGNHLEFSGRIDLPGGRVSDAAVIALLPDGFRPSAPRTLLAPTAPGRQPFHIQTNPHGHLTVRLPHGSTTSAEWIGLDGISCRLDQGDD